jgi:hypothetical protein
MKIDANLSGVGTSARVQAFVRLREALARREVELRQSGSNRRRTGARANSDRPIHGSQMTGDE